MIFRKTGEKLSVVRGPKLRPSQWHNGLLMIPEYTLINSFMIIINQIDPFLPRTEILNEISTFLFSVSIHKEIGV